MFKSLLSKIRGQKVINKDEFSLIHKAMDKAQAILGNAERTPGAKCS